MRDLMGKDVNSSTHVEMVRGIAEHDRRDAQEQLMNTLEGRSLVVKALAIYAPPLARSTSGHPFRPA
jgi:hypothetical protein